MVIRLPLLCISLLFPPQLDIETPLGQLSKVLNRDHYALITKPGSGEREHIPRLDDPVSDRETSLKLFIVPFGVNIVVFVMLDCLLFPNLVKTYRIIFINKRTMW